MAARVKAKQSTKKRQQRATSNIFSMFNESQIQEFKEAFNIIDHDRVCLKYLITLFYVLIFNCYIFTLIGWFYKQ